VATSARLLETTIYMLALPPTLKSVFSMPKTAVDQGGDILAIDHVAIATVVLIVVAQVFLPIRPTGAGAPGWPN